MRNCPIFQACRKSSLQWRSHTGSGWIVPVIASGAKQSRSQKYNGKSTLTWIATALKRLAMTNASSGFGITYLPAQRLARRTRVERLAVAIPAKAGPPVIASVANTRLRRKSGSGSESLKGAEAGSGCNSIGRGRNRRRKPLVTFGDLHHRTPGPRIPDFLRQLTGFLRALAPASCIKMYHRA
jgi:hypothetical protein